MIDSVREPPDKNNAPVSLRSAQNMVLPSQVKFPADTGALYPLLKALKPGESVESIVSQAAPEKMTEPELRQLLLQTTRVFKSQIELSDAYAAQVTDMSTTGNRIRLADRQKIDSLETARRRLLDQNHVLEEENRVLRTVEGPEVGQIADVYVKYKELRRHSRDLTTEQIMAKIAPDATLEALRGMLLSALAARYTVEGQKGLTHEVPSRVGYAKSLSKREVITQTAGIKLRRKLETRGKRELRDELESLQLSTMDGDSRANKAEALLLLDPMTGLTNKVAFEEQLEISARTRLGNNSEHKSAFSIFLDLNDFKFFNFIFGHPRGDDVIRHVASVVDTTAKQSATDVVIGRLGGDEFGVLVLDRRKGEPAYVDARDLAAGIKQALIDKPFEYEYPLKEFNDYLKSKYEDAKTGVASAQSRSMLALTDKERADAKDDIVKYGALKVSIEVLEKEIAAKVAESGLSPESCDDKHEIILKGKFLLRLGAGMEEIHEGEDIAKIQSAADDRAQRDKIATKTSLGSRPLMEITSVYLAEKEKKKPWAGRTIEPKGRHLLGDSLSDIKLPEQAEIPLPPHR